MKNSATVAFSASIVSALRTPRLNEPSGIFTTTGKPSVSAARTASAGSWMTIVSGIGQAGMRQPLPEIDLVGAADHRDRIVDDRHALHHGAAGEVIGVVADRRRLADEERIELREPREILLGDRLDLDPLRRRDLRPVHQRLRCARRQHLLRVVENGDRMARRGARLRRAPFAAGVGFERARRRTLSAPAVQRESGVSSIFWIEYQPFALNVTVSVGARNQSKRSCEKRSKPGVSQQPEGDEQRASARRRPGP